jgi:hypothetical protein
MKMFACKFAQDEVTHQRLRVGSKKSVQQGRSHFDARSVCGIREHGKMARTPLAAFFNRPGINPSPETWTWVQKWAVRTSLEFYSLCEKTLHQVPARTCGQMSFRFYENIHCG